MQDIVNVIHKSSEKALNLPQLVGDEDGKVIVPTYDWKAFFATAYKKVVGLKTQGNCSQRSTLSMRTMNTASCVEPFHKECQRS